MKQLYSKVTIQKLFIHILVTFSVIIIAMPLITFAHSGRTASDGCHYCRTNCSSYGVGYNERHCHNSSPTRSYSNSATSKSDNNDSSWMWWVGGVGLFSYLAWAGREK